MGRDPSRLGTHTFVFDRMLWKWFAELLVLAVGAVITDYRWARRRAWHGSLRSYLRCLTAPVPGELSVQVPRVGDGVHCRPQELLYMPSEVG